MQLLNSPTKALTLEKKSQFLSVIFKILPPNPIYISAVILQQQFKSREISELHVFFIEETCASALTGDFTLTLTLTLRTFVVCVNLTLNLHKMHLRSSTAALHQLSIQQLTLSEF